ncbi:MAG TPA: hypothetical protein VG318_08730 [Actinomycetota bacterium]|nr:hypothetical protein [Actinomycetota bacterium]
MRSRGHGGVRAPEPAPTATAPVRPSPLPAHALRLQRVVGNRATAAMLQRTAFLQHAKANAVGGGTPLELIIQKAALHSYLVGEGHDTKWVAKLLAPLHSEWQGKFTGFGGVWRYDGPKGAKPDPGEIGEIMRTVGDVEAGRIKSGVVDYSGDNVRDGVYKLCTQSFVEKHVLPESHFASAQKQGKQRMAGQRGITKNSVIPAKSMVGFQGEVAKKQGDYAKAFATAAEGALAEGSVVRHMDFVTDGRYEVESYDSETESVIPQNGKIRYSVVQIGKEYLVNHFAGVA